MKEPMLLGWLFLLLAVALVAVVDAQRLIDPAEEDVDQQFQYWLRRVQHRGKRSNWTEEVLLNETGKCVIHAGGRTSKSCNSAIKVSTPPIPPSLAGACQKSRASGREVCYPRYEDLDTSCTDVSGTGGKGLVAPPTIQHA
uniref:Secreted protein n=1 Tax=Plectus sambesii TaxID=2011161 RepID=A0A914UR28_9BILA